MKINTRLTQSLSTNASQEKILAAFNDVPSIIRLFPKLDQLQIDGDRYHWLLEPLGAAGIERVVEFATDIELDQRNGRVDIQPIAGFGNAQINGRLDILEQGRNATIHCELGGELDLKIPLIARADAGPFIKHRFAQLIDVFAHRVREHVEAYAD